MLILPRGAAIALALALWPTAVAAQPAPPASSPSPSPSPSPAAAERPSEDAMFGGDAPPPSPGPTAAPGAPPAAAPAAGSDLPATPTGTGRDDAILGTGGLGADDAEKGVQNPLTIGGQFYLRSIIAAQKGQAADQWALSSPNLVDGYFDARPNDRVRGMMVARMKFDPSIDASAPTTSFGPTTTSSTTVLLDQLWLRFDIEKTVYVTAGRQHTRWGTGRFWQPTDFLHPQKRDPLAVFDERTGSTYVKLHLPWEARAWNFYAVALLDGATPVNQISKVGGAARAEAVFGEFELGLDAIVQKHTTRAGADLSFGLGDFDLYTDVGLRPRSQAQLWDRIAEVDLGNPLTIPGDFQPRSGPPVIPQITAGLTWSMKYNDNDVFTLGAEYFYNGLGSNDPKVYLWEELGPTFFRYTGKFDPNISAPSLFYLGRHYAAVFASLPAPGDWNKTTFNLSTLANASDGTFFSRFDYSFVLLTHLTFEAFLGTSYGKTGGEFRQQLDVPSFQYCRTTPGCSDPQQTPEIRIRPTAFQAGLALRVRI